MLLNNPPPTPAPRRPVSSMADVLAIETGSSVDSLVPWCSTYDMLVDVSAREAKRQALCFLPLGGLSDAPQITHYFELAAAVTRAGNVFHASEVSRADTVCIVLPNLPQTFVSALGAQSVGISMLMNPALSAEHLTALVAASGAKVLVVPGSVADPASWLKVVTILGCLPSIEHLFTVGAHAADSSVVVQDFDVACDAASPLAGFAPCRDRNAVASYFHTGGTTGAPKLAALSHWNLLTQACVLGRVGDWHAGDTHLLGLPIFHANGFMVTGLATFMTGARTVILGPSGFRNRSLLADIWRLIERTAATRLSVVPTVLASMMQFPVGDADLSSLVSVVCGAAPLPAELGGLFESAIGAVLVEGYGLTEGTCVSTVTPHGVPRSRGSVGLRVPFQELCIFEEGRVGEVTAACPAGVTGALAIRGANVFVGYRAQSGEVVRPVVDGWLDTGDRAFIDGDGYVFLCGRTKDLIIRGGHNIDPAAIEEALHAHPRVALAAAIGQPDAHAGEVPVAYVTLNASDASVSVDDLLAFVAQRIFGAASDASPCPHHQRDAVDSRGQSVQAGAAPTSSSDIVSQCIAGVDGIDPASWDVAVSDDSRQVTVTFRLPRSFATDRQATAIESALALYSFSSRVTCR